jgi:hypothetical protein
MVDYLPRSAWRARPPNGGPGQLTVSRVEGAVIHWPGSGEKDSFDSQAEVAAALRGWQNFHMDDRGWSDIAYQVAVDQAGRAWTLRGLRNQSGANGNNDLNERYGAILLVLITGEQPSAAMKATVRGVIADFRKIYPEGTAIKPHSAVRPDGTDCPGPAARAAIARGDFNPQTEDDDVISTAQMTELKNHITREVRRFSIWELRWLTQTEDERQEARAKFDAAIAGGKTPEQAAAIIIGELAPLDDSLEETQNS